MPRPLVRNFTGGEVTPEMFGRFDLAKQQTGLALCYNYAVLPHGPVVNRGGFEYVNETKFSAKKSRVIEFNFDAQQTYVIEVGHLYLRLHTGGATLLHTAFNITNVTNAVPARVDAAGHDFVAGDWVFLDGIVGPVRLNGRFVKVISVVPGVSFRIADLRDADIDTSNLVNYPAYVSDGTAAKVLEIPTPYTEDEVFGIDFTQSNDVLTIVHQNHPPAEVRRLSPTSWTYTVITFLPTIATPTAPTFSASSGGTNPPVAYFYLCTAVAIDTLEESLPSPSFTFTIDLSQVNTFLDIQLPATVGAIRMNLYKLKNGIFSFAAQTLPGGIVRDNNIAPDANKTAPFLSNPFPSPLNYPGAVSYFEGRRVFAGTLNKKQNYFLTASGTESNMNYSIPTQDDDAISGRIVAREVNAILRIVPLANLLFLTTGGEWKISPDNSDVLTPANAFPKQQSAEGASRVKYVIANGAVIFVHEAGSRLRRMEFKWQSNGWNTDDITVLAPHLFALKRIVDLAHQKAPHRIVWAVRSDGALLGVTYHPEHEVTAWHQHGTRGEFESVACVKEDTEYPVYAVVKRRINDTYDVRYIERSHTREIDDADIADSFFVDAGITYDGDPANVIGGLWHLVGEEVVILGDGAVHPRQVVDSLGRITLELGVEVSKAQIGLGYVSRLQTIPPALENFEGFGIASNKVMGPMFLRVNRSSTIKAGPTFERMRTFPARANELYGDPPSLLSGVIEIPTDGHWTISGQMVVEQDQPLPSTVLGLVMEAFAEGGDR